MHYRDTTLLLVYLGCAWCQYWLLSGASTGTAPARLPGVGFTPPLQSIVMPLLLFFACQVLSPAHCPAWHAQGPALSSAGSLLLASCRRLASVFKHRCSCCCTWSPRGRCLPTAMPARFIHGSAWRLLSSRLACLIVHRRSI